MKDKIIKIAEDLEQGTITETKARTLLLGLFGVSGCLFKIGDIVTDGVFEAEIESMPTINADFRWTHNDAVEHNKDISRFILK